MIVHPKDPDIVWVAAQGNPWGPNEERGVYYTENGGESWERILYVNEGSGIGDLSIDETNPRNLMAVSWEFERKPWVVKSGGPGSQVHKTTDGGQTWKEINKGLPELKGKMGVSISPANPDVVYLAIEAKDKEGGVYKSTDGGNSFTQSSNNPNTYARAWYYMHIFADPNDENLVYVFNGIAVKSIDGGKTFQPKSMPHGDHHALWINPHNSNIMVQGNDGGATVTMNRADTWSSIMNQPTGQFYRVITDNQYPYRVYSSQQDENAIVIDSVSLGRGIGEHHWESLGVGESATIGFDPNNPKFVYTTAFASMVGEWDRDTKNTRDIRPFPERITGEQPKNLKYRANWIGPIIVSPHNPEVIYYGSQYLMKSTNRGTSWDVLSQDLTRNDKEHQGLGGYPISNEQITAESYNNVFVIAESPLEEGVIWTGSDDGLVHITRDGGKTFENVTPRRLKEGIINVIDASPHHAGTAYIAVASYKMNDFTPHLYKTDDYGKNWKQLVKGIPEDTFVRSVREDPKRQGLLYAGTETGMFVSFDDGKNWQSFQLNLPEVPITDLHVRQDDLVVATQGRALWILDDLTPLHQISKEVENADYYMFKPRDGVRDISLGYPDGGQGQTRPKGIIMNYVINTEIDENTETRLEVLDNSGAVIRTVSSTDKEKKCGRAVTKPLDIKQGANVWLWDLRQGEYPCLDELKSVSFSMAGYKSAPGNYQVRLRVGEFNQTQSFTLNMDPRLSGDVTRNANHYQDLERLTKMLFGAVEEMSTGLESLRAVKRQLAVLTDISDADALQAEAKVLGDKISAWENKIVQKNFRTFQNIYQMEAKFLLKVKGLIGRVNGNEVPVSKGSYEVAEIYMNTWAELKAELNDIKQKDVAVFNEEMAAANLPQVYLTR